MERLRWLLSLRSLFMLVLACAMLIGPIPLLRRHAEMWLGSDNEHAEGNLFVEALEKQFPAGFAWNMKAQGNLRVMVWGIAVEHKQDEIRDWAVAEKARTGMALKVTIEFYESKTNPPQPDQLLRVVEF